MRISDLLETCLRSLARRKVRTLLTVIGVVIGTCAIIVTISLGEGMRSAQMEMISQWTDLTSIQVYQDYWSGRGGNQDAAKLNDNTLAAFHSIEHVKAVSPSLNLWNKIKLVSGKYVYEDSIRVIDLSVMQDLGYELKEGEFPSGSVKNLIYLGEQAPYNFYDPNRPEDRWNYQYDEEGNIIDDPPIDPMHANIGYTFVIEGEDGSSGGGMVYYAGGGMAMAESSGSGGNSGLTPEQQQQLEERKSRNSEKSLKVGGVLKGDYAKDDGNTFYSVYIDVTLAQEIIKEYNRINDIKPTTENGVKVDPNVLSYDQAIVKVDDMNNVDAVETAIKDMGFSTYSFESQRKPLEEQTQQMQLVFGGLGGISLLVAAIGIANTMVMSIYERTREIGVMKVLGCELRDIRLMFLVEAAMIGLIGGLIGLGMSFGLSAVINAFQQNGGSGYASVIPFWLVLLGLGFATLVGIISGFSPANRAVKISALSAIRQE